MPKLLKIGLIVAGSLVCVFAGLLIRFGGTNTLTLSDDIRNRVSLIPKSIILPNLTEKLTDEVAQKILENNPEGPTKQGALISNPETIASDVIREQLANFNPDDIWPVVSEKMLVINKKPTNEDRAEYFKKVAAAMTKDSNQLNFTSTTPTKAEFLAISKYYKLAMADIASLSAPADAVAIHIHLLELVGAQANAFELLSNYASDPVKAILAADVQKSIAQESEELSQTMVSYIEEHGLTL